MLPNIQLKSKVAIFYGQGFKTEQFGTLNEFLWFKYFHSHLKSCLSTFQKFYEAQNKFWSEKL
jgi:hypothetical protein